MEKPRVAGQLPSAAAVPGWRTFIWPRAWPQTSADHAFGFPYILWNGERGRRVHLTRGEGGLERDIKRNTRRWRLGSWGSCLPPDPHPMLHGAQVHKYGRWAAFLWCSRLMIARRRCVDPAWPAHRVSHLKTRKKTRPGCSCWSGYKREGCRSMMSATHQRISIPTAAQTTDKIRAKASARAAPREARGTLTRFQGLFLLLVLLSPFHTVYRRRHCGANYLHHHWIKVPLWCAAMCRTIEHEGHTGNGNGEVPL